ncbi:MAG: NIPSNAP family protein [Alphaproteobacteria bacterium]
MIVEMRTYTLKAGKVPEFAKAYQELGEKIQVPILGNLVGAYTTEIGPLNQIIHLWGYADMADRDARRAKLAADKDWPKYIAAVMPLLEHMENKILLPLPWSPVK